VMAAISLPRALGEPFALIRRRPLTVLTWGAVNSLLFAAAASLRGHGSAGIVFVVLGLASMALYCAVARALLRPEEGRFAYVRFGLTETLMVAVCVGMYLIGLIGGIVSLLVAELVSLALGVFHHATAAPALAGMAVAILLFVWLSLRLSLLAPLAVDQGKVSPRNAWALADGHMGRLIAIGLFATVMLGAVMAAHHLVQLALGLERPGPRLLSWVATSRTSVVFGRLVAIPFSGVELVVWAAPWTSAYRDLVPAMAPDPSVEFA